MMRALYMMMAIVTLPACDAYDRDVGPVPYLCGASEPRCPEDYTCATDSSTGREICVGPEGNPNEFVCADDTAVEPNNETEMATVTPLDAMKTFDRDGAICPAGDKDVFKVMIRVANQKLEVLVESEPGGVMLSASILNRAGGPIAIGMPVAGMPNTTRAVFPDLPVGEFFAQVAAPSGTSMPVNNYQLSLKLTGP